MQSVELTHAVRPTTPRLGSLRVCLLRGGLVQQASAAVHDIMGQPAPLERLGLHLRRVPPCAHPARPPVPAWPAGPERLPARRHKSPPPSASAQGRPAGCPVRPVLPAASACAGMPGTTANGACWVYLSTAVLDHRPINWMIATGRPRNAKKVAPATLAACPPNTNRLCPAPSV